MNDTNGRHIFFVDDEPKVCQVIAETLSQTHLDVSCFACPMRCLKHLRTERCDLLIADLRMPKMNGIELAKEAKRSNPWMPVLILTGYGDIPSAVEAIKAGAVDFIEKPFDKTSFLRRVKVLLPENGNHRQLGKPLTPSELRVLRLVINGKSNKETANLLNRSVRTVEVHRAHLMRKLGADNLVELLKRAIAMGLVNATTESRYGCFGESGCH